MEFTEFQGAAMEGIKFNHPKIVKIEVVENYKIIAVFNDGSVKEFDFKPLLKEKHYEELNNLSFFKMAKIDAGGYGISWSDMIDIDSNDIWVAGEPVINYTGEKS